MPGQIILILSCMFSGKTETLISYARRYIMAKKKIQLIKHKNDTRYTDNTICSHNRTQITATFVADKLEPLSEEKTLQEADVILIDEGQFFEDAAEFCDRQANAGKIIVIAALSGNYKRKPFPVVAKLISLAEEIIHLKSVCDICGNDAHFTKRISADNDEILVGGSESYLPRCRSCFNLEKSS